MKCEFTKWIYPQGCWIYKEHFTCNEEAVHFIRGKHYCQRHSRLGRYVIREGDVGKIVFRCDTEQQLRTEFIKYSYPYRMQKLTRSHRRDIF
jgi:hypothetical protein